MFVLFSPPKVSFSGASEIQAALEGGAELRTNGQSFAPSHCAATFGAGTERWVWGPAQRECVWRFFQYFLISF